MVYKRTFPLPGGRSISLNPGVFDRLTLSSVWIMSLTLPSVWRAVHTPYSLNEDDIIIIIIIWFHSSISVCLRERSCACLSVWMCLHYFRSCSVTFLLSSLVLSKCYCRVFQWDESAYTYINRREYNWLYTSYTPCHVLISDLPHFSSTQTLWEGKLECNSGLVKTHVVFDPHNATWFLIQYLKWSWKHCKDQKRNLCYHELESWYDSNIRLRLTLKKKKKIQ